MVVIVVFPSLVTRQRRDRGDLCDQLVGVKQLQQSSDFLALTFVIKRVRCDCEQLNSDVCIPEPLNRMFAPHHRCDQFHVFLTCRIQTAMTSSVCAHRPCQSPHAFPRVARISGGRECVEVTPVRSQSDFTVTRHVRHAFGHREPAQDHFFLAELAVDA